MLGLCQGGFRHVVWNVFVKPNEQCRACSNICHGEKTHFSRNEKEHVWGMANAFGDVVDCNVRFAPLDVRWQKYNKIDRTTKLFAGYSVPNP